MNKAKIPKQEIETAKLNYNKSGKDMKYKILSKIRSYTCAFAPTINFRDWLIKEIKEMEE